MGDCYIAEFTCFVDTEGGIEDISLNDELKIYPLPVRDKLNISAGGRTIKSVRIVTVSGTIVISENKPSEEVQIDTHALVTGVYLVNVVTNDGS